MVALTFYQLEKPDILFDRLPVSPQFARCRPVWSSAEQSLWMATDEDEHSPLSAVFKSNNARQIFYFVALDKLNIKNHVANSKVAGFESFTTLTDRCSKTQFEHH